MCYLLIASACVPITKDCFFELNVHTDEREKCRELTSGNETKDNSDRNRIKKNGTSQMTKHAQGNVHIKFYNFSVSFFFVACSFVARLLMLFFRLLMFCITFRVIHLSNSKVFFCSPFYFENYSTSKEEGENNEKKQHTAEDKVFLLLSCCRCSLRAALVNMWHYFCCCSCSLAM